MTATAARIAIPTSKTDPAIEPAPRFLTASQAKLLTTHALGRLRTLPRGLHDRAAALHTIIQMLELVRDSLGPTTFHLGRWQGTAAGIQQDIIAPLLTTGRTTLDRAFREACVLAYENDLKAGVTVTPTEIKATLSDC